MSKNSDLSEKDIQIAFHLWLKNYRHDEVSQKITKILELETQNLEGPWLKKIRGAQMLSLQNIADRLEVRKNTYFKFEQREINGTLQLVTLKKSAEALGCELIYFLRPKNGHTFTDTIWAHLFLASIDHSWIKHAPKGAKGRALAKIATDCFKNTEFRKSKNWKLKGNY